MYKRNNSHFLHYVLISPDLRGFLLVNLFEKLVHNAVRHFFVLFGNNNKKALRDIARTIVKMKPSKEIVRIL